MKKKGLFVLVLAASIFVPYTSIKASELKLYNNKNISYSDLDKSGTFTAGDKITIGTEGFYFIDEKEIEENSIKTKYYRILAEKNIDCTELIQKENAENFKITNYTNYNDSGIKACVENYAKKLNDLYDVDASDEYLKKFDINKLGFTYSGTDATFSGSNDWLVGMDYYYYHHHNTYKMDLVSRVYKDNDEYKAQEQATGYAGVRPFIKIPVSSFSQSTVTVLDTENGSVDATKGENGEVILNITTDEGYVVDNIEVKDTDDNILKVTENKFNLAGKDVTVKVVIVRKYELKEEVKKSYKKNEVASFKIDADYSLFENGGKVYIDDELVDSSNYSSESGSTIINFTKEFMNKLASGNHVLKVVFNNNGVALASFTVENDIVSNPNTVDNINIYLMGFVLSIAGLILIKKSVL